MAATQLGGVTCETVPSDVAYSSLAVLFELGTLLESVNQLVESEQTYIELLSTPQLPVPNRIQCLHSLAHVSNQQKKWRKGLQYGKEALELLNVASFERTDATVMLHVGLLVELGDAMEGQGDWGCARQYDRQAWSL